MYLTLPVTLSTSRILIFIDDAQAASFGAAYYPLNEHTADVFLSGFSKEHRTRITTLLLNGPISADAVDEITEIVRCELSHALDLADECSN